MSIDHRAEAIRLLKRARADSLTGSSGQASGHAILALADQVAELVAHQRLANYLTAMKAGVTPEQFNRWEQMARSGSMTRKPSGGS